MPVQVSRNAVGTTKLPRRSGLAVMPGGLFCGRQAMKTPPIDRGTVARIAQKSTQRTHAEVIGWTVTRISSGGGEAAGIYKISGTASDSGTVSPWSLILKILQPAAESVESSRWNNA